MYYRRYFVPYEMRVHTTFIPARIAIHACSCRPVERLDEARDQWISGERLPNHIPHAMIRGDEVMQLIPWMTPTEIPGAEDAIVLELIPNGNGEIFHSSTLMALHDLMLTLPELPLFRLGQCGSHYTYKNKEGNEAWSAVIDKLKPYQYLSFPDSDHCHECLRGPFHANTGPA